jgi:hypothetical protein
MAAHRYWRLYINSKQGGSGSVEITEWTLRTSPGGSQAATGGTASASSQWWTGGYPASGAFDGNSGSLWISDGAAPLPATPQWLKYDFGAGNAKDIVEFAITASGFGGSTSNSVPQDFALQWSDDDSTWTAALSVTGDGAWIAGTTRTFTISAPVTARPVVFVCC